MKSSRQLFAELKRRSVFKVAAVYGVTAFVLLQIADLLGQGLRLPDSFLPFITAVILLGFPLALIVAWAFELTPEGVQRTQRADPGEIAGILAEPGSRLWPSGLLALVGLVSLLAGAWWAGAKMAGRGEGADTIAAAATVRADSLQLALADPSEDGRPAIAVLPFLDMSPQSDQQYFSDGITEEILNTLVKIHELKVAARTSAFAFRDRDLDMRAIGDSLGVGYLIEGSVRKAGDQLRITAQLIDASDGTHVWSDTYDRTMDDVFAIQTEIAQAVASQLRVPLGLDDPAELVNPTGDLEAYDLYLAARARMRERGASLQEARHLFEAAIARDSSWAPAWAGLAEASEVSIWYAPSWDAPPTTSEERISTVDAFLDEAVQAAERALALDPSLASAHVALGSVARNRHQWKRSEQEYRTALSLDPDNAEAHQQYAEMLSNMGRMAEARVAARRAMLLDRAPIRVMIYGASLAADGQPEAARRIVRTAIDLDPQNSLPQARAIYHRISIQLKDYDHAFTAPEPNWLTEAVRDSILEAYRTRDPERLPAVYLDNDISMGATPYAELGRPDRAIEQLERLFHAMPYGNFSGMWVPAFDDVRARPEFQRVLELLNLEGATVQRTPRDQLPDPETLAP
jgi:TolB-like protein